MTRAHRNPAYMTPKTMRMLETLQALSDRQLTLDEAAVVAGCSRDAIKNAMYRYVGSGSWPADFTHAIATIPVRDPGEQGPAARAKQARWIPNYDARERQAEVDALIERGRRMAEEREAKRLQLLEEERRKYNLPQRGRSIMEMPL